MSVRGADQHIKPAVSAWEGITAHLHRFGGTAYRLGDREIGHIHGDGLVDIPFPPTVKHELVAAGQAAPHHVLPGSGWVSFRSEEGRVGEESRYLWVSEHLTKKKIMQQLGSES